MIPTLNNKTPMKKIVYRVPHIVGLQAPTIECYEALTRAGRLWMGYVTTISIDVPEDIKIIDESAWVHPRSI